MSSALVVRKLCGSCARRAFGKKGRIEIKRMSMRLMKTGFDAQISVRLKSIELESAESAESFPGGFGQLGADDLDDFAGALRALCETFGKRAALGMTIEKTAGEEIACAGGVEDGLDGRCGHTGTLSVFDGEGTACTALHDGDVTSLCQEACGGFADFSCHGARFVFIGKDDVYMRKKLLEKCVFVFHDVP